MDTRSRQNSEGLTLFSKSPSHSLSEHSHGQINELSFSNPDLFIKTMQEQYDWQNMEVAKLFDHNDSLHVSRKSYDLKTVSNFTSIASKFIPSEQAIINTLHDTTKADKKFDEKYKYCVAMMQTILGYADAGEFNFTPGGFTTNLMELINVYYRPRKKDWEAGRTLILMPESEYELYGKKIEFHLQKIIDLANDHECFNNMEKPDAKSLILLVAADNTAIVDKIKNHASQIQILLLPNMNTNTGECLLYKDILDNTKELIEKYEIKTGLNLGNSMGFQKLDLKLLPLTFALGIVDKNLHGINNTLCGIYLNKSGKYSVAFPLPSPIQLAPLYAFLEYFCKNDIDMYFAKATCLTRYLHLLLNRYLGEKIKILTNASPLNQISFMLNDLNHNEFIAEFMLYDYQYKGCHHIDLRADNIFTISLHYGYTNFRDIYRLVDKLVSAIGHIPQNNKMYISPIELNEKFIFNWTDASTIAPSQATLVLVKLMMDKMNMTDLEREEEKYAYAALNFKIGTFNNHISEKVELALPELCNAEKYFSGKPEYMVDLAWTKNHIVYSLQQLISNLKMDKNIEQNLQYADQYHRYAVKLIKELMEIYQELTGNHEWFKKNALTWIKLNNFTQYVIALVEYQVSVISMIINKYEPKHEEDLLNAYRHIYLKYEKYGIMDDGIALIKNNYADMLSRCGKYEEADIIFKSLEQYWRNKNDSDYRKRFMNSLSAYTCKVKSTVKEEIVKRGRSRSRSRRELLTDFITSGHKSGSSNENGGRSRSSSRNRLSSEKNEIAPQRKLSY